MPNEGEKEKLYGGYKPEDFPAGESAHIQQLVADKQEEAHNLEYKSAQVLQEDPVNLCRAVCSFLNSEGGVIIVGVKEEGTDDDKGYRKPSKIEGTTKERSLQWLQDILLSGLLPAVPPENFRMHQFPDPNQSEGRHGYVIFVPRSYTAPHQVRKRAIYYRRGCAGCVPMLDYEIMDMVGARRRPRLTIDPPWYNIVPGGAEVSIRLCVRVKNTGMAPARNVALRLVNGRGSQPVHRRPQDEWRSLVSTTPGRWVLAWEPRRPILPGADECMYLDFHIPKQQGYDGWCRLQLVGQVYVEEQEPVEFGVYVQGEWRAGDYVHHEEDLERGNIPIEHLPGLESGISLGDRGLAFGSSL